MQSNQAQENYTERRQFERIPGRRPLKFRSVREEDLSLGTTINVSRAGLLMQTTALPKISSILWLDIDFGDLPVQEEVKDYALSFDHGFLGRVVRVDENPDQRTYDVGICFVNKDSENLKEFKF